MEDHTSEKKETAETRETGEFVESPANSPIPPAPREALIPSAPSSSSPLPAQAGAQTLLSSKVSAGKPAETSLTDAVSVLQPVQIPQGKPLPPKAQTPEPSASVRSLRTFRGDVETVVHDQRTSIISIAAAESERRGAARGISLDPQPRRSWRGLIVGASVTLVLLGAVALVVVFLPTDSSKLPEDLEVPSFFFVENQKVGDVGVRKEKTLLGTLASERASVALPLGSMQQLILTTTASTTSVLPARDFLLRLGGHIPASLARVALPAFMLGTHVFDGNQPFLIVKVDPYEQAYAAMLEWEPYLLIDLAPFFPGEASTTIAAFKDEILDNKNVRVVRTLSGKAIALYSFLDRSTLLITTNEYTLREVLGRLTRPRI